MDELGPQLSLLNMIASHEQSYDLGKTGTSLIASIDYDTGWIINLEATDHMTYDHTLFSSTTPPSRNSVTTNEGVAPITKAGSMALTLTLSLHLTYFQTV